MKEDAGLQQIMIDPCGGAEKARRALLKTLT